MTARHETIDMGRATVHCGDALTVLRTMPDESVHCAVTSPPYFGLRSYIPDGLPGREFEIGSEPTVAEWVARLVEVFREMRRVLRADGTFWLNVGDGWASGKGTCRNPGGGDGSLGKARKASGVHPLDQGNVSALRAQGYKPKDLLDLPGELARALRHDGWHVRSRIVWMKPNPMVASVRDRPTASYEFVYLLTRSARYYWDRVAAMEPGMSGESDLRKMQQKLDRIGGKTLTDTDPLHKANRDTNIGQKRGVGEPGVRNMRDVWIFARSPIAGSTTALFLPSCRAAASCRGVASGDAARSAARRGPGGLRSRTTPIIRRIANGSPAWSRAASTGAAGPRIAGAMAG